MSDVHTKGIPFMERQDGQCAFPLWADRSVTPLSEKRVCGQPVEPGLPAPYCGACFEKTHTAVRAAGASS